MKTLRDKILDPNQPVIFYELLPPASNVELTSLQAYVECATELLMDSTIRIDAVNIPDVRAEESEEKHHEHVYKPKLQPGYFAQMLEKGAYPHLDIILNHCTVYEPWLEQKKWLENTVRKHKIKTLILVGGTSSKIHYPGPSVIELSDYVNNHFQDVLCGGIVIQTRRRGPAEIDEPYRMLTKAQHGIKFFTSQIVFDANSVKTLLEDYANVCEEKGVAPQRVFLSFAPIANKTDMAFLRWLGVEVSKEIEARLFRTDIGIGWRSAQIATAILEDILLFIKKQKITVPIGLNIEHITRHNFELSLRFIERLGEIYYRHFY